jgi:hypothetical protein
MAAMATNCEARLHEIKLRIDVVHDDVILALKAHGRPVQMAWLGRTVSAAPLRILFRGL